jgi:Tfp pilus assembly protein PilF
MFFSKKIRIVALVSFLVLTGCGGSKDREKEYLSRAQTYFDKGNYDKTRVELKNVLQINPKNIDARYSLKFNMLNIVAKPRYLK